MNGPHVWVSLNTKRPAVQRTRDDEVRNTLLMVKNNLCSNAQAIDSLFKLYKIDPTPLQRLPR